MYVDTEDRNFPFNFKISTYLNEVQRVELCRKNIVILCASGVK